MPTIMHDGLIVDFMQTRFDIRFASVKFPTKFRRSIVIMQAVHDKFRINFDLSIVVGPRALALRQFG